MREISMISNPIFLIHSRISRLLTTIIVAIEHHRASYHDGRIFSHVLQSMIDTRWTRLDMSRNDVCSKSAIKSTKKKTLQMERDDTNAYNIPLLCILTFDSIDGILCFFFNRCHHVIHVRCCCCCCCCCCCRCCFMDDSNCGIQSSSTYSLIKQLQYWDILSVQWNTFFVCNASTDSVSILHSYPILHVYFEPLLHVDVLVLVSCGNIDFVCSYFPSYNSSINIS
jgi:hypothetical protein